MTPTIPGSVSDTCYTSLFYVLQELKNQRDKLKQYQKKINVQIGKDRMVAKQLLKDGKKE